MLEHQKTIIENVSYDHKLFEKELLKSLRWLDSSEILQLYIWVKKEYGMTHYHIIKQVFSEVAA